MFEVKCSSQQEESPAYTEEPPSGRSAPSASFRIGRDSRGNWVAQDQWGLRGGLFVDLIQALRFALFENGNQPNAVTMVPGVLELDMWPKATRGIPSGRWAA